MVAATNSPNAPDVTAEVIAAVNDRLHSATAKLLFRRFARVLTLRALDSEPFQVRKQRSLPRYYRSAPNGPDCHARTTRRTSTGQSSLRHLILCVGCHFHSPMYVPISRLGNSRLWGCVGPGSPRYTAHTIRLESNLPRVRGHLGQSGIASVGRQPWQLNGYGPNQPCGLHRICWDTARRRSDTDLRPHRHGRLTGNWY